MKIDFSLRRSVTLRPIVPTKAQADRLYRIYAYVIEAWSRSAKSIIVPEYARTLSRLTSDSPVDIEITIEQSEGGILQAILGGLRELLREWTGSISLWHLRKITESLKYATNVDLETIIRSLDGPETLDAALQRNVNLIRSVSDQVRQSIADIVFRGLQSRTSVREIEREIAKSTGLARARSRRIAADQVQKLSAALDRDRMTNLGITEFEWMHSGKLHPREWHKARDGKRFRFDDPKLRGDMPGDQPFCGCKARGIIE